MLKRYRRRPDIQVTAIQLELDTDGFTYLKWGSPQKCKAGDWLVNSQGEIYTIDRETFAKTYRMVETGRYVKHTCVWTKATSTDGVIETKEGRTHYKKGDFLVYNERDQTDGYAISQEKFQTLYESDEEV